MRVAYGDSNVLRCNVQFAYDRFFTASSKTATHLAFPQNEPSPQSKDVVKTIAQTNVEDIGKGFYNINMGKTNKKHDVFKNFKQRPENAGAGFYNQNTSK